MYDAGFQGKGSDFDSQGGSNFGFLKLAFSGVVQAGELSGSAMWYMRVTPIAHLYLFQHILSFL